MPCYEFQSDSPSGPPWSSGFASEADCLNACKEGACCNGTTCSVKPQCQCDAAAGEVFKGVGTVCSPNPCNPCCPLETATNPAIARLVIDSPQFFSRVGGGQVAIDAQPHQLAMLQSLGATQAALTFVNPSASSSFGHTARYDYITCQDVGTHYLYMLAQVFCNNAAPRGRYQLQYFPKYPQSWSISLVGALVNLGSFEPFPSGSSFCGFSGVALNKPAELIFPTIAASDPLLSPVGIGVPCGNELTFGTDNASYNVFSANIRLEFEQTPLP